MKIIKQKYNYLIFILVLSLFTINSHAQDSKYKGALIYQFTRLIEWTNGKDDFIIGIVGNSEIIPILEEIAKVKKVNGKNIIIRRWESVTEISDCKILFLPKSKNSQFEDVLLKANKIKAVLITESDGLAKKGAGINFIKVEGKITYELNKEKVLATNNKVDLKLERLAQRTY